MVRSAKSSSRKKRTGEKRTVKAAKAERGSAAAKRFRMPPSVSRSELLDENGPSDRRFRQFLYDFSVLGSSLESARSYLASQLGLSSPQYKIVMIVAQYQGAIGVSGSDIAQHLHVTTAFITSEAGKLEQMEWLEKRPNPRDGRSVLLRLTSLGEAKVRQIGRERRLVNDRLFRGLSGKDFRHLTKTFAALIDDFAATASMLKTARSGEKHRMGNHLSLKSRDSR